MDSIRVGLGTEVPHSGPGAQDMPLSTYVPCMGEAPVLGLGDSVPEADDILGLKVYFTQNTSIISYFSITHSYQCLRTLLLLQISIT